MIEKIELRTIKINRRIKKLFENKDKFAENTKS